MNYCEMLDIENGESDRRSDGVNEQGFGERGVCQTGGQHFEGA